MAVTTPEASTTPMTMLAAILRVAQAPSAVSIPNAATESATSAAHSARSAGGVGASSSPATAAMASVAPMLTAVNATASTAISTLRAARSARRFGWALSTFLAKPPSNSAVKKMATKIANRHARAPPLKRELPTRDSADRFCTSDSSATLASAMLPASEKPT